ncbi:hypothetical protein PWG14_22780 (plasmid) [Chromobacterium amazonense]|uniref:hypothetical protein n=1 Tax=Chromobacterium amazonense TaxID=1382803 RepID=UPI00237DFA7F|nr:hypothetical protein [Chromobacterium amazonense]MDE1715290.1 hypothetical protein [Chromobacterium amazonense]
MTLFAFPSEQTRLEALRTRLKLQFQHGALPTQEDYYLLIDLLCDCVLVAQSLQAGFAQPRDVRIDADDPLFLALEQRDVEIEQRLQRLQTQLDGLKPTAAAIAVPAAETELSDAPPPVMEPSPAVVGDEAEPMVQAAAIETPAEPAAAAETPDTQAAAPAAEAALNEAQDTQAAAPAAEAALNEAQPATAEPSPESAHDEAETIVQAAAIETPAEPAAAAETPDTQAAAPAAEAALNEAQPATAEPSPASAHDEAETIVQAAAIETPAEPVAAPETPDTQVAAPAAEAALNEAQPATAEPSPASAHDEAETIVEAAAIETPAEPVAAAETPDDQAAVPAAGIVLSDAPPPVVEPSPASANDEVETTVQVAAIETAKEIVAPAEAPVEPVETEEAVSQGKAPSALRRLFDTLRGQ